MNMNHFYPKMHTAAQISTKRPALKCKSDKSKIIYVHRERVLCSVGQLQREFYGGSYYPEWKICIGKRGCPYYPKCDLVQ